MTNKLYALFIALLVLGGLASNAHATAPTTVTCNDGTSVEVGDADPRQQAEIFCLTHGGVSEERPGSTSFSFRTLTGYP